ncbi:MAG: acetyl-CoA C-acyltransferase [Legionellales bacterium]|nr:acetyl-CoA C-acyltransferase [Legionellales bacterium]
MNQEKAIYLVDGVRTPFIKYKGKPGLFRGSDLGVFALRSLLNKLNINSEDIDEMIVGCVASRAEEANIARYIAIRAGLKVSTPAWTVGRNCGSGMQAVDSALCQIKLGRSELVIAGGVDSLSRTHMLIRDPLVEILAGWSRSSFINKLRILKKLKLKYLLPESALVRGLCDPLIDQSMGATAENLVEKFNISRKEQDEFALQSHQRLQAAIDNNLLKDVIPIAGATGEVFTSDDGVRKNTSLEDLAKLKPYFDKKYGSVTAGNSSQITDGGVMLLIASEDAVNKYKLVPRAKIIDCKWAGLEPSVMGLGPAFAIPNLLISNSKKLQDIDYWEINEAFSVQVLSCLSALNSKEFCQDNLGLKETFGEISRDKLNIYGGAISCGHPLGASGARLLLHLLSALENNQGKFGVASQCIGGGQGGAMLIEKI